METEAAELLDDVVRLRRQTRRDRHGYWLPLLFLGVLVLAAPLAYLAASTHSEAAITEGTMTNSWYQQALQSFFPISFDYDRPLIIALYWLVVIALGLLVTVGWYRWRANRVGVQSSTKSYVWFGIGALTVFLVAAPFTARWTLGELLDGMNVLSVWVSITLFVVGAVLAGVCFGRPGTTRSRSALGWSGLVLGGVLALVGADNLVMLVMVVNMRGYGALLVISIGLFALAWVERSVLCGVIAVLFTGAALLANLYDMEDMFDRLFKTETLAPGAIAFDNLVLPAMVLLFGGIAALIARAVQTSRLALTDD